MFGQTTITPLPPEYLTDYAAWDDYMARVWAKLLETTTPTPPIYVIEFGCGTSQKIGKALAQLHFTGTLYVVDPCTPALTATGAHYRQLLPQATIHLLPQRLEDAIPLLPTSPDWLVSNHPLDDMLLAYQTPDDALPALFDWGKTPKADISSAWEKRWQGLQAENRLPDAQHAVLSTLVEAIDQLHPQAIAISQYASSALNAHPRLRALNDAAQAVLAQLRTRLHLRTGSDIQALLNQHPHYQNHFIGTQILNAQHWLVGAPA